MDFSVEKMTLTEESLSHWARFISLGMNILRSGDRDKDLPRAPLATSTGSIEPAPGEKKIAMNQKQAKYIVSLTGCTLLYTWIQYFSFVIISCLANSLFIVQDTQEDLATATSIQVLNNQYLSRNKWLTCTVLLLMVYGYFCLDCCIDLMDVTFVTIFSPNTKQSWTD